MSDQRPSPNSAADEAAALRQTGASPLRVGDPGRVGPFVPLALLGSGGMGRVYLARAADDGPGLFAVKVIRPEYAEDVRFQRRFAHEAAVHARLGPPHTPRLRGTGWDDELLWMATEYVPGLDLADAVRQDGALTPATVWRLVTELGRALAALAAAEVVHRDLKPSNVLLSLQGTHVIDFGISKAADASAITGTGNRVGTPAYMSPEYLRTGHCDTASDVFSLAGTLLYAATGRAPFGDGTGVDVMHRVAFEEPNPEVTGAVTAADPELGALLTACLAKEPERRPTPQELIDTAEAQTEAGTWPEPLHGQVLARQRAYETLHRLPVERAARLRPSDNRMKPAAVSAPPPVQADPTPAPSAETEPARTRPAAARPWVRRKRVWAVAAGTLLCAVAATLFVLLPGDGPATAASPETAASTPGASPGDPSGNAALPGASDVPDAASAAGAPSGRAVVTDDGGTAQPEPSVATTGSRTDAPTAPVGDTSPSATPAQSPTGTAPTEPGSQPWNTDCTYYAGSGRTRPGDSGKRVLQVQCMLTERGYTLGDAGVNGDFGPGTESAVRSFQNARGLTADGIVAHDTWAALRDAE
ncbi:serine/threonine-protein kinase [Streptomyces aurantiogriseus]|uniref:Serine/threonine protein kinase n=1 Tax=Streptomyces aurantiogriseus TaxID=66870 RepID=A0A918FC02_9ACTN|nr:serine/threonine-protein kinase [Streptomyces aurantiogriseus]GGR29072.1 serine/threonine protein kinase [Streptomyces aurantiogriseus]